jgi:diacylglycerol O-acyltransferase
LSDDLLAPLDLSFWHADTPDHPLHLGALAVLATTDRVGAAEAAALLAKRAAAIPRLRMRVRDVWLPPGGAAWTPDSEFDITRHVHLLGISGPNLAAERRELLGELLERPLHRGRAPWEIYVVNERGAGTYSVVVKMHHALADGMRALALGMALFDRPEGMRLATEPGTRPTPERGARLPVPDLRRLPEVARSAASELQQALSIGAAVGRATLESRPIPALNAPSSGSRRLGTVRLELDEIHRIRKTVGGTVNDVLIALVTGVLRRFLEERGEPLDVMPRALIPVSRRRPRQQHGDGNRLSGYLVQLPVGTADPLQRLREVHEIMQRHKAAGFASGAGAVTLLADQLPPVAHRLGGPFTGRAARLLFDVLVTSVPIPDLGFTLGGSPLLELYPLAPLTHGHALAIAISTYRNSAHLGLVADGQAVPSVQALAAAAQAELSILRAGCNL